jgi:oxygen-independent coproporphyrinogen-3 oxidase
VQTFEINLGNSIYNIPASLLAKYDKVGPRYTSYPTAPEWRDDFSVQSWESAVNRSNEKQNDVSLYFHLPFCKSACYYCACNFVVSPQNTLSETYIEALSREIKMVGSKIDKSRKVKQLHFGGGTPTYISLELLEKLYSNIQSNFNLSGADDAEFSIEIDPRVTSREHLKLLRELGFTRVSMGIQDFNDDVQKAVNRIQSFELVKGMIDYCRELGFQSVNFDLIYGLPLQTHYSFEETLNKVVSLSPDRVALFNYAHLPSLRPFQKAHIIESQLPPREEKFLIFCSALKIFGDSGYEYIGMDHFAKKDDELCIARADRTLHRNFQGYTTKAGCDLYGMGMTSISSIDNVYSQNEKRLNKYLEFFDETYNPSSILPIEKGIESSPDDLLRRDVISRLLCHGLVNFSEIEDNYKISFKEYFPSELAELKSYEQDGIVRVTDEQIQVETLGRIFLRNIVMPFDKYLKGTSNKLFSRTV